MFTNSQTLTKCNVLVWCGRTLTLKSPDFQPLPAETNIRELNDVTVLPFHHVHTLYHINSLFSFLILFPSLVIIMTDPADHPHSSLYLR